MINDELNAQVHAALFRVITAPYKRPTDEAIAAVDRYLNQKTTEAFERMLADDPEFKAWVDQNFVKISAPQTAGD